MVVKHSVTATFPDEVGAEINKTEWNADHLIDDATFTIAKTALLQAALDAKELLSAKDAANGYAGLSASSKLSGSQQTYGTAASTACEGDDSRLSDDRAPTTHLSTKVSDFTTAVQAVTAAIPLNSLTGPSGSVDYNGQKQINLGDPTLAQDGATKSYVDALSNGLAVKNAVNIATTENIILSGHQVVDGITTTEDMRILVKDQTDGEDNGYYLAKAIAWTRTSDADVSAEVSSGMFAWVITGTANGAAGFALTTAAPIVLDTTVLSFTQFSGLGQVVAGAALTKTANTMDVGVDDVGIEVNADALRLKDDGVVYDKIQNMGTQTILGRDTAGSGSVEALTGATVFGMLGAGSAHLFYQVAADYTTAAGGGSLMDGKFVTITAGTTYTFEVVAGIDATNAIGVVGTELGLSGATVSNVFYVAGRHSVAAIPLYNQNVGTSESSTALYSMAAIAAGVTPVTITGTFTCTGSGGISFNITHGAAAGTITAKAGSYVKVTPTPANGTWA
jgi:hypothetical protein